MSKQDRFTTLNSFLDKEVINIVDGSRMGYICDMQLDVACGKIIAVMVPSKKKLFDFSQKKNLRKIYFDQIEKIGDDTILVRTSPNCNQCEPSL